MDNVRKSLALWALFLFASPIFGTEIARAVPAVGSPATFTIDEGDAQEIDFTLDEPIICPDMGVPGPHVTISFTRSDSSRVSLSSSTLNWDFGDWTEQRTLTVTATDDSTYSTGLVTISAEISSCSEYYDGYDPTTLTVTIDEDDSPTTTSTTRNSTTTATSTADDDSDSDSDSDSTGTTVNASSIESTIAASTSTTSTTVKSGKKATTTMVQSTTTAPKLTDTENEPTNGTSTVWPLVAIPLFLASGGIAFFLWRRR